MKKWKEFVIQNEKCARESKKDKKPENLTKNEIEKRILSKIQMYIS